MDWYQTIFELIDMRSFSNLWFWIALAVVWSSASHWVIGVPWDMVLRARRHGGQSEADLDAMVHINVNRILFIVGESHLWLTGFAAFFLTMLFMLGFVFAFEFAQAVFLLAFPMTVVGILSVLAAKSIRTNDLRAEPLRKRMQWHRLHVQMIGMVAIFCTAMWGMFQNISSSPLGG